MPLPPVVVDAPPLPVAGLPAVIVLFGLCGRCMTKDGHTTRTIEETHR